MGRKLLPTEDVHHINGDGRDNRIENLLVLSHSDHLKLHTAQRTPEQWAKIAAGRVGTKRSPETRAKMADARKRWWAKRKK